jgi:hypothetical protein
MESSNEIVATDSNGVIWQQPRKINELQLIFTDFSWREHVHVLCPICGSSLGRSD